MKIKDVILEIESLSFKEALEYIIENSQKEGKKTFVVTINPEIIMLAMNDESYEKVLKSADLALADGVGVVWAGKMFGKSFKGRVHGSDLVEKLSQTIAKQPITVGFLGGRRNVATDVAKRLQKKYSGLKVAFAGSEYSDVTQEIRKISKSDRQIVRNSENPNLRQSDSPSFLSFPKTDILFVAFGSPKQERWIYENLANIDVRVAIGVGGAFDFILGRVRRAPVWVRSLGLEWLFRLIIQPWRIKRQAELIKFVFLVLKEKLS